MIRAPALTRTSSEIAMTGRHSRPPAMLLAALSAVFPIQSLTAQC